MTKALKIDSSAVGLYMAKEQSINVLPSTPVWQQLEPSEIGDIGGETTQTSRTIIRPDRQNNRGAITDLSASADFTQELSQNNANELFQGFCFAKAHEQFTTKPLNVGDPTTTVSCSADTYTLTDTTFDTSSITAGTLIKASGFTVASNNGLKVVDSVSDNVITVTSAGGVTTEDAGDGVLEVVGKTVSATITISGKVKLGFSDADDLGLELGQWVFVGGDTNKFANNDPFYARIGAIESDGLVLDFTTNATELTAESATTIDLFYGMTIHNEKDIDKIKRTTYTIEERLGFADQENTIPQASYVSGCVPSEITINIENSALSAIQYTFTGCRFYTKKGTLATGTRLDPWDEKGYNNANEVYLACLSTVSNDPTHTAPNELFAFMSSGNISINNNTSENKAVGCLGAFDISVGKFDVTANPSVYFVDVDVIKSLKENVDVGMQVILARNNEGIIFDIPMMGMGASIPSVSDGEPLTMDLTANGAKSKYGYTFAYQNFKYLPDVAMASDMTGFD